jgi:hypothetical protein
MTGDWGMRGCRISKIYSCLKGRWWMLVVKGAVISRFGRDRYDSVRIHALRH